MDQNPSQDDDFVITIQIVESQLKDKVTSYMIRGEDKMGAFEASRRFNDFYVLRVSLVNRWPGCYIPPIPSKQTIGNTEVKVIEDRKRFLQYFCEQMALYKYLFYSDEFQTFLRTKNADMEKTLNSLPKLTTQDIFNKYKSAFAHLNGKEINTDMTFKTSAFGTYLAKSVKALTALKDQVKVLGQVKKQYTDHFTNMTQVLIPEYEKNILFEYADQKNELLIFTASNEVNVAAREIRDVTQTVNNFDMLVDMIRIECREVEAFQEALVSKDNYEKQRMAAVSRQKDLQSELSKLLAGKTTLKSFFSKGSSADQVQTTEKKIQDNQVEIDNLTLLCDIITLLLGHEEIDSFKRKKSQKYLEVLTKLAQAETELNGQYLKLWTEVAKSTEQGEASQ